MATHSKELFSYKTLVHAISGALGSVIGMTTFYPLDTVRSRLQLEDGREAKNTVAVLSELIKEEGLLTLYRGLVPVLQSLCCSNFVYFYTFHGLKSAHSHITPTAGKDLVLASIAGIINVITTTPLWVVNTRLKMAGINKQRQSYKGLIDGLRTISKAEGIPTLWSGTLPSILLVTNPALQMAIYETIKRHFGANELPAIGYFLIGAISKTVAAVLTYPLQLVQTKLRHGHGYKDLPPNAGMIQLTLYILKKYGAVGLYKGMEAKLLQTVLTSALMFAVYEKIARFVFNILLSKNRKTI
uniref:Peroxisomal membrane protein PMP34 n=1 Tax=Clastoptera arizonana TaxID=38151 RepID=A0A1B6BWN5_9HEMI